MRWPFQQDRIREGDGIYPCPKCSSTRAKYLICPLGDFVRRDGAAHSIQTGGRLCCQECSFVYCVDIHGTYNAHPDAFPLIPRREVVKQGEAKAPTRDVALPPPPKEPPRY